jgi:hypothetical protein
MQKVLHRHAVKIGDGLKEDRFTLRFGIGGEDAFDERSHPGATGAVVRTSFFVLTKPFDGGLMLWHGNG